MRHLESGRECRRRIAERSALRASALCITAPSFAPLGVGSVILKVRAGGSFIKLGSYNAAGARITVQLAGAQRRYGCGTVAPHLIVIQATLLHCRSLAAARAELLPRFSGLVPRLGGLHLSHGHEQRSIRCAAARTGSNLLPLVGHHVRPGECSCSRGRVGCPILLYSGVPDVSNTLSPH